MRYFIGITGVSTAGKSTLGVALLSSFIKPEIFPIPHTTRRLKRQDDDQRLIRCIDEEEFKQSDFLTIDQNYGTLKSDYLEFISSEYFAALSVVSCNEIPDLRRAASSSGLSPVFISLTLTNNLDTEGEKIEERFPNFFTGDDLPRRMERDKKLAKDFFFSEKYLEQNSIIALSQEDGGVLDWIHVLQNYVPISYDSGLIDEVSSFIERRLSITVSCV